MGDRPAIREGEIALPHDPAARTDAGLVFIGRIRSPWARGNCPKNISKARAEKPDTWIELKPEFAPALAGLTVGQPVILLYWMDNARRDLVVQAPAHVDAPRGTFALRSPNRPNPIAAATVRITALDGARIGIDAIDCFDGTPLVDIKPWLETIDIPPA
ncbi:tRNA (N6-threonylcarbamoyladenosine(37)-N6)-methyltransferase TrmO [Sinisalibacter aestuarii]|uniref:tRNA (N6-threonylcarbamoyladenosine(37)-N6)-methyltransferase TrmO n=1 Tax=Sinisalibacter aestuarii TaxID=2949426 RepID=A0ABQ5LPJ9_9RHOB|nr:tRNA (N6-threonylcarbamoyladenosine(37)-N6)-methyltransferase TrmO [Sinisalibacter aestuarii]GKY86930.1 tRNA (N6-threonylcarbamoyladenosine(37)-N6)-methyltransferase TrmO [Sinisalibacter aestuarii]